VVIALFFLTDYVRQNLLNNELNKNGIETTAVITGFEFESIKSNQIEYATIQYEFENQIIIQRFRNFNHEYNFNQTLPIRISTKKPFMFELIETKKY
jgi:hypothetical protein